MTSRLPTDQELQPLLSLGISRSHATKGLQAQQFRVNQAIDWCLTNPEQQQFSRQTASTTLDEKHVQNLKGMGFSEAHARNALLLNGNNFQRSMDWCLANPEVAQPLPPAREKKSSKISNSNTNNSNLQQSYKMEEDVEDDIMDTDDWVDNDPTDNDANKTNSSSITTAGGLDLLQKQSLQRAKLAEKQRKQKMKKLEMERMKREEELEQKASIDAQKRDKIRMEREAALEAKGVVYIVNGFLQDYGASQARETVGLVVRIIDTILKHPSQPKYRKVKLSAKKIQKDIVRISGGVALLKCAGFRSGAIDVSNGKEDSSQSVSNNNGGFLELFPKSSSSSSSPSSTATLSTSCLEFLKKFRREVSEIVSKHTATCIPELMEKARNEDLKKAKPSVERIYFAAIELRKLFSNVIAANDADGRVSIDFLSLDSGSQIFKYRFRSVPRCIDILKQMGYKEVRGYWRVVNPVVETFVAAVEDLSAEISKIRTKTPVFKATSKLVKSNPGQGPRVLISTLSACLGRIIDDPDNVKYHKLKLSVLFRKSGGFLNGSRQMLTRLGFKVDDVTETATLRYTRSGEVDLNLVELRRNDLLRSWGELNHS
mmetsp:Transcript_23353/g.37524  ORF Transcript_23353/g.37524 Transcript_23353/m.37524 type:complete len:599 (+) Transcript_23353:1-1797(+)